MALTFDPTPELEQILLAQAKERGLSLKVYLEQLITDHLRSRVSEPAGQAPEGEIEPCATATDG